MEEEECLPENLICPIDGASVHPWVISTIEVSQADVDKLDFTKMPFKKAETLMFKCDHAQGAHRFRLTQNQSQPVWQDVITGQLYPVIFAGRRFARVWRPDVTVPDEEL